MRVRLRACLAVFDMGEVILSRIYGEFEDYFCLDRY